VGFGTVGDLPTPMEFGFHINRFSIGVPTSMEFPTHTVAFSIDVV
jgi:hypothetical protein